ncbi:MAG: hypothetical protein AAFT19_02840 [Pseudomonadota bacterium]
MYERPTPPIGPILILDDLDGATCRLSALFIVSKGGTVPPIDCEGQVFAPALLTEYADHSVHRIRFTAPADRPCTYRWGSHDFPLASDFRQDLRIAFASCNGEEHGDLARDGDERNAMWARLAAQHREAPFSLLLHGGDQIYADEATKGHPLSEDWP